MTLNTEFNGLISVLCSPDCDAQNQSGLDLAPIRKSKSQASQQSFSLPSAQHSTKPRTFFESASRETNSRRSSSAKSSFSFRDKVKRNSLTRAFLLHRHSSFEAFRSNLAKVKFLQKNLIFESENENSSVNLNLTKSDGKRQFDAFSADRSILFSFKSLALLPEGSLTPLSQADEFNKYKVYMVGEDDVNL